MSQVADGQNGYLVDWSNVGEARTALTSVLNKKRTDIKPLQRNTSDAMAIIEAHVSQPLEACKRFRAACVAWPLVLVLWFLSLLNANFAADPKRNQRSA